MDNELLHGSRIHRATRGLTDGPSEAYPWYLLEVVACLWSNRPLQSFKAASWIGSCWVYSSCTIYSSEKWDLRRCYVADRFAQELSPRLRAYQWPSVLTHQKSPLFSQGKILSTAKRGFDHARYSTIKCLALGGSLRIFLLDSKRLVHTAKVHPIDILEEHCNHYLITHLKRCFNKWRLTTKRISMVCELTISFLNLFYWRVGQAICAIDILLNIPKGRVPRALPMGACKGGEMVWLRHWSPSIWPWSLSSGVPGYLNSEISPLYPES